MSQRDLHSHEGETNEGEANEGAAKESRANQTGAMDSGAIDSGAMDSGAIDSGANEARPGSGTRADEGLVEAVVIGASAGGVEALLTLLRALPDGFALPVLVVLHVSPSHKGRTADVFARQCRVAVHEAEDKTPIAPGTVFLAPPGYHLQVEPDRTLSLSLDEPVHYSRPSIDVLFESAAFAYGPCLLAVVLTGASRDGSAGLATVKRFGGATWVQDPSEASSPLMPEAALRAAQPDRVLRLDGMATRLANLKVT